MPVLPAILVLLAATGLARSLPKSNFEIEAGPKTISPEEKAIRADPASGIEHAVILLEETDQDDAVGILSRTRYHLRAKILSNLGRGLANVEIPLFAKEGSVKKWWGHTILPDGTVLSLKKKELTRTSRVRVGRKREHSIVKAILPGVVPGAIIDYGYEIRDINDALWRRLPLQRRWFMREFRYRWTPLPITFAGLPLMSAANVTRGDGLEIKAEQVRNTFTVVARDLPPVVIEPLMPPLDEVRASAIFYYTHLSGSRQEFWNRYARETESEAAKVLWSAQAIERWIESMGIPPEASLETKLRTVYDWIGARLVNLSLEIGEEPAAGANRAAEPRSASKVLESGEGSGDELDYLFLGAARSLGARAELVRAADRTDHYWSPDVLAWWGQFDETLVAVRRPGEPASRITLVDAGSGLDYGEVPWWVEGTRGLLAGKESAGQILVKGARGGNAVSETVAEIEFASGSSAPVVSWVLRGKGQHGLLERRELGRLDPSRRSERLAELCGAGEDLDLIRAELPELSDSEAEFGLSCKGELTTAGPAPGETDYRVSFTGQWIQPVPLLDRPDRTHPLVFPFPRQEIATVRIAPPPGFSPQEPPGQVRIESEFGNYFLDVSREGGEFLIQRTLSLPHQRVERSRYEEFRRFLSKVRSADTTSLEFTRIEEAFDEDATR